MRDHLHIRLALLAGLVLLLVSVLAALTLSAAAAFDRTTIRAEHNLAQATAFGRFTTALTQAAGQAATFAASGSSTDRTDIEKALATAQQDLQDLKTSLAESDPAEAAGEQDLQTRAAALFAQVQQGTAAIIATRTAGDDPDTALEALDAYEPALADLSARLAAHQTADTQATAALAADVGTRARFGSGSVLLLLAGALLVALLAAYYGGVRPARQLAAAATAVAAGDLTVRVPATSRTEIGTLQRSFTTMVIQLQATTAAREAALARAQAAQAAAETANAAKSAFLANMSHELRTPLNAVLGYGDLLRKQLTQLGQPQLVSDLDKIAGAGQHLLDLINDLLDLSKIEAGKMDLYIEAVTVPELVAEVATIVRPLIAANSNEFVVECPADQVPFFTDVTKVRQVLFNLLSNAAKFTEKGQVRFTVARRADQPDWIDFRIADSGIGMSAEQLAGLFQVFTQADTSTTRRYGGTGLGLALSRRLAQMLDGDILVQSTPGAGSTFTLRLPITPAAEATPPPAALPAPQVELPAGPAAAAAPLVLVIDDDPAVGVRLAAELTAAGYRVATAQTGESGLRAARELQPLAITLDVLMPGLDGWAVLGALKADPALAAIPVIMLTIVDNPPLGFLLGATDYLLKPVDPAQLRAVIAKYRPQPPDAPVLVVEDDAPTREMLVRTLEAAGWEVATAAEGTAGLAAVAQQRPALILLDLMMPALDGFGFIEALRQQEHSGPPIPIIVLTAADLTTDQRTRLNGAVVRIIQKGKMAPETLLREVRIWMAQAAAPA